MQARWLAIAALAAAVSFAADVQSMGGSWKLNTERSKWGKRDKPSAVTLQIEHIEPAIRYHGTAINADASDRRDFKFDGAIDGKPHPANGPDGDGTMTITRTNRYTTKWTFRSADGKVIEDAITTVSRDGRRVERRMHRKGPTGEFIWTEVYEKVS